ncbi:kelch repeat-containing protein [Sorangium sp. So ce406]|uniref:kelch repeat-containing protein n=1 Tax=Sorangium sp. So ce406 TaxID=3133311 RepID=UPI003F5C659D
MPIAGSTRHPGLRTLALFWTGVLAVLLGCSEIADPLDARALRRQFPEQADAILQGPFAFTAASGSFEPVRSFEAPDDRPGEAAPRPRFPMHGDGALRLPLGDGSEARVRELGAAGEGAAAENAIAYPRAGGTSFWTALEDGYEEWLLLEPRAVRRDAPVASWHVDGAMLRQQGEAVELADARGAPQVRVTAPAAYAAGGRPIGTRLVAEGERLELWVEAEGETVLVDPRWKLKRKMSAARARHTATPLLDGRVLVTGGQSDVEANELESTAQVFDPTSDTWRSLGTVSSARVEHTATRLRDGRVLVAGGSAHTQPHDEEPFATAAVFDPAEDTWSPVASMSTARARHSATLLPDGRVLVAGGHAAGETLAAAEVFDPASGTWTSVPSMSAARHAHTATLLPGGRVLVAGGRAPGEVLAAAEMFDPASGTWTSVPSMSMSTARHGHSATSLPDGRVLVIGGGDLERELASAEVFDPASGTWASVASMSTARYLHTAESMADNRVLVAGGYAYEDGVLDRAEVYDPASGAWLPVDPMVTARHGHTSTSLPDGRVLVAGGGGHQAVLDSVEVFDPASSVWRSVEPPTAARAGHTATPLPDGRVLVAGGLVSGLDVERALASAEVFDPAFGAWSPLDSMSAVRLGHTATPLPDGRVLVAGGGRTVVDVNTQENTVEVFDPATERWSSIDSLSAARQHHTATLLLDGRVLVAGGYGAQGALDTVETLDPASSEWLPLDSMTIPRSAHTATLLPDGRVLVAGGYGAQGALNSAEVFDPASGGWVPIGPLISARAEHRATLLPDGRVLVIGGYGDQGALDTVEALDPAFGTWVPLAPMHHGRLGHSVTLLPEGLVLVTGGSDLSMVIHPGSTEAFDPTSNTWSLLAPMLDARRGHAATPLPDGRVLVSGGGPHPPNHPIGAEVFQPMPNGSICTAAIECQSGFCADGVCCDRTCNVYLCEACSDHRGASADGVCTSLHPDYAPFACSPRNGRQAKPCSSVRDCVDGYVCDGRDCVLPPPNSGFLDGGGCHLATPAAAELTRRAPAELGLLLLAAVSMALRRRRG